MVASVHGCMAVGGCGCPKMSMVVRTAVVSWYCRLLVAVVACVCLWLCCDVSQLCSIALLKIIEDHRLSNINLKNNVIGCSACFARKRESHKVCSLFANQTESDSQWVLNKLCQQLRDQVVQQCLRQLMSVVVRQLLQPNRQRQRHCLLVFFRQCSSLLHATVVFIKLLST